MKRELKLKEVWQRGNNAIDLQFEYMLKCLPIPERVTDELFYATSDLFLFDMSDDKVKDVIEDMINRFIGEIIRAETYHKHREKEKEEYYISSCSRAVSRSKA